MSCRVFAGGLLCCTHCPNAHSTRLAPDCTVNLQQFVRLRKQCRTWTAHLLLWQCVDAAGLLLAAAVVVVYRLSSVEAYDPREGRWSELTSMQVRLRTRNQA